MKKWFNAYLTFIIGLGTLISIYAFATEKFSISILFIVVLIAVTLAESFAMLYNKNFAFSLSGSILILAAFNMDLIEIVVIGILHEVISKPIYKYFQDINYKLIDKKLFFNIGAKIIALTIVYLVIEKLKFLSMSFNYFIVLAMIIIGYYFLSHLLVNIVVYLYTGDKNQLKFNFKQESLYLYFFTIVTIVMEYGYLAFGIIGFIVLIGLILPLQSTMLNLTIAAETRQKQIRDRLTNAYNQAYLEEIIEKRLRDHEQFHLIFFNIIDFKSINSTHGREVGDEVLKHFTGFLQKLVSSSDKVFRYEGNEFCVLIELKNHGSEAINKLEKPRKIMYESFQNGIIKYHYAIGAYHYEGLENITFSEIMNIADQKIYCSKFT